MATGSKTKDPDKTHTSVAVERDRLAHWVLIVSGAVLLLISADAVWWASTDRAGTALQVFTAVLPLLGTWVGTVLAYYFTRQNLDAAAVNTRQLLGLKDGTPVVADVMLSRARMIVASPAAGTGVDDIKLAAMYEQMDTANVMRLPVLDATGAAKYIVHKSTLDGYAKSLGVVPPAFTDDKTMGALAGDSQLGKLVRAMGFIGPQAPLADAQRKMGQIPDCNDIFVTKSGDASDPVIGWLTNTDLAGKPSPQPQS